ncbi:hypothetical protein QC762_117065 [Podospora pseudocomata]|uniref:Ecp2 effector protein-like domain-containing protein n=1 Tax=Podospora pseudocomata TaxID=2093779 RepID=A0ABR0GWT2_9PEZI|nr:hypothetical protein QC762_117065 [Podospora pseudocomata]
MQLANFAITFIGLFTVAEAIKNCQSYTADVRETLWNSPAEMDCYAIQATGESQECTYKASDGQVQLAASASCHLQVRVNGDGNEITFGNQDAAEIVKLAISKYQATLDGVLRVGGQGTVTCGGKSANWSIQ